MKETVFESTRLVLTKEERRISKSWGRLWNLFGQRERSGKGIYLLLGDWSGYKPSQHRITHVGWNIYKDLDENYHGTVKFTDNTTMSVWIEKVTRKDIVSRKMYKNETYSELINDLIKSGSGYYDLNKKYQTA